MKWEPIKTAPTDGQKVLATFEGQFEWIIFIAHAGPDGVRADGHAKPTHWMPLPEPPK